jgi:membrane carboxypeptidase/penicillin-binding protein
LPEPAAMQSLLQQISEQKDVLRGADAAATQANVMALIERATDAYFTAKMREQTALRMKDAAISMLSRGETARAADLLVVAGVTGATDDVAPAHAVPFLRGFFQKAFGLAAARAARPVG